MTKKINGVSQRQLINAVAKHAEAQCNLSWAGSRDPDEADEIERAAEKAKAKLELLIAKIFHQEHDE